MIRIIWWLWLDIAVDPIGQYLLRFISVLTEEIVTAVETWKHTLRCLRVSQTYMSLTSAECGNGPGRIFETKFVNQALRVDIISTVVEV